MGNNIEEYRLKVSAKLAIGFLFIIVGIPMLYTSILNFQINENFWGIVLLILLLLWALIVFRAISFKIRISDSQIEKSGLISSNMVTFSEVNKIHFGSTFSNFYLQSDNDTIYISKDFKGYDDMINQIVNKIKETSELHNIKIDGNSDKIQKYGLD